MRRVLLALHTVIALNAIGGGVFGLSGAEGVPMAWLDGSPFSTYVVPSLILLMVVGGSQFAASVQLWRRAPFARATSVAASVILLGWIGTQIAIIGFVSWLQPAVAVAAIVSLLLVERARWT